MGMSLDRVIKLEQSFYREVSWIYRSAAITQDHSSDITKRLVALYAKEEFQRMPRYARTYVQGAAHALSELHWQKVVFSYSIDGVRMKLTDDSYKVLSPQEVHEKWSDTGCFVYINSPCKLFTTPTREK